MGLCILILISLYWKMQETAGPRDGFGNVLGANPDPTRYAAGFGQQVLHGHRFKPRCFLCGEAHIREKICLSIPVASLVSFTILELSVYEVW